MFAFLHRNPLYPKRKVLAFYSKTKELAPFALQKAPFQKGGKNNFDRVASPESVSVSLKTLENPVDQLSAIQ